MPEQLEPTAPTVSFVRDADIRVQGDRQREQDRADYFKDIEDRRQRSAELAEKRRQSAKREVNLVEELDAALVTLEAGATDFEQTHGKANEPLITAKLEVNRLRNELDAAETRLGTVCPVRTSSPTPGCVGLVKPDFRFRVKLREEMLRPGDRGGSGRAATVRRGGVQVKADRLCDQRAGGDGRGKN
jgi:hypothetical protein